MARFNELLVGRYNRLAQKLFSMKGPSALNQLDNSMQLALGLFHGAENRYLEGWDLFGVGRVNAAPGAGNTATFTLRNPVGSNVMGVITRAALSETTLTAQAITLFRPGSAGANAGDENTVFAPQGWDGRGRAASTLVASNNVGVAAVVRVGGVLIATLQTAGNTTNETIRQGDEIPLTPGSAITFGAGVFNEGLNTTVWWRERFLEDSERS